MILRDDAVKAITHLFVSIRSDPIRSLAILRNGVHLSSRGRVELVQPNKNTVSELHAYTDHVAHILLRACNTALLPIASEIERASENDGISKRCENKTLYEI